MTKFKELFESKPKFKIGTAITLDGDILTITAINQDTYDVAEGNYGDLEYAGTIDIEYADRKAKKTKKTNKKD